MNICFTGHRPNKLASYDWHNPKNQDIIRELLHVIVDIMDEYFDEPVFNFITGGALGIDQMAYFICNELKSTCDNIELTLAIPFKEQASKWNNSLDLERYVSQINSADNVVYVDTIKGYKTSKVPETIYHPDKLAKRNKYMVDNADMIIAVWDGHKNGGTYDAIAYSNKCKKPVTIINSNTLEISHLN